MSIKYLIIYAGNVTGTGATQVVKNILSSLNSEFYNTNFGIKIYLPINSELLKYTNDKWDVILLKRYKNKYLHFYFRALELFKELNFFDPECILINLGDIPLKFFGKQYLLFHNINIIDFNKKKLSRYFILNFIFKWNLKYTSKLFVQSPVVKEQLITTLRDYDILIEVLPMPINKKYILNSISEKKIISTTYDLFYPASYYNHKNFELITYLPKFYKSNLFINLFLTIDSDQLSINKINSNFNIIFLNEISHQEVLKYLNNSFALFFPSLRESYGIPLIEAMLLNKIIVCADLPYARWMCEENAIYFNPKSPSSAIIAINEAIIKFNSGYKPNWSQALSKIPDNWDDYLYNFLNLNNKN
jgi:hypothetical protein